MSGKNRGLENRPGQPPQLVRATHSQLFSGPIPPPESLDGYEKVCPGAADRIIKMAEIEQSQRHKIETRNQRDEINNERIGMVSAFSICLVTICGGVYCILHGQPIPGGIATAVPLGAIVLAFLQGRKKN